MQSSFLVLQEGRKGKRNPDSREASRGLSAVAKEKGGGSERGGRGKKKGGKGSVVFPSSSGKGRCQYTRRRRGGKGGGYFELCEKKKKKKKGRGKD